MYEFTVDIRRRGGLSLKGSERENRGATGNEGWGYK